MKGWYLLLSRTDYVVRSLMRSRGKTFSILFLYTLVVFLTGSALLYGRGISRLAEESLSAAPEIIVQGVKGGRFELLPAALADNLTGIRGVQSVTPRRWGYLFDPASGANLTIIEDTTLDNGTFTAGFGAAKALVLFAGERKSFVTVDGDKLGLKLVQILPHETDFMTADIMRVSPADFIRLTGIEPHQATDFALAVRNPQEVDTVAAKIISRIPHLRTITRLELARTYDTLFSRRSGMVLTLGLMVTAAFLVLVWDKAAGLSARERQEIGILKGIGWDTPDILRMKLIEGLLFSLTAFLAGLSLSLLHIFLFDGVLFASVMKGWAVVYPSFTPAFDLRAGDLFALGFLTVVPYIAATLIPAWKASVGDPDEVMR